MTDPATIEEMLHCVQRNEDTGLTTEFMLDLLTRIITLEVKVDVLLNPT